ncbi:MAG: hypothetical protein ACUVXG_09255 [Anaerolineae bacterium]
MPWTYCPECDARILVPRSARMGDLLECPECNETLEVINLDPLELETACGLREELLLGLEGDGGWDWQQVDEDELGPLEEDLDEFAEEDEF